MIDVRLSEFSNVFVCFYFVWQNNCEKINVRMIIFDDFWKFENLRFHNHHYCIGLDSKMKILFCEIFEISFRLTRNDLCDLITVILLISNHVINNSKSFWMFSNISESFWIQILSRGQRRSFEVKRKKRPQR